MNQFLAEQFRRAQAQLIEDAVREHVVKPILKVWRSPYKHSRDIPCLFGPTGSGKTKGTQLAAQEFGLSRVFRLSGKSGMDIMDTVGINVGITRATGFLMSAADFVANNPQNILIHIDEATRFDPKSLSTMMEFLDAEDADTMASFGEPAVPSHTTSAPLAGGRITIPSSRMRAALSLNPWGTPVDPAMRSRVVCIPVPLDPRVLSIVNPEIRAFALETWKSLDKGMVDMPYGLRELSNMDDPDDWSEVGHYLSALMMDSRDKAETIIDLITKTSAIKVPASCLPKELCATPL